MKTKIILTAVSAFCLLPSAFGQGALTPPGAPAPTMKSLSQIEPRTAITNTATAVTITNPGSYYLTGNLTISSGDAITIATNGVTLDLGGFTIASTAASAAGYAIYLNSGLSDLTILNGHIRGGVTNNGSGVYGGSGFGYGIYAPGTAPVNTRVSGVSVSGCLYSGIFLGNGDATVVESCTVRTVGVYGIVASTIKSSVAVDCGNYAMIGDQVSDCRGQSTGSGYGLYASATALNCYGTSSSGYGLYATTAQNCYGTSSSGTGLNALTAQNCYGTSISSFGLIATTAQNCYGTSSSGTGLYATTAQNCHGVSGSGTGLYAFRSAVSCYGESSGTSGVGLYVQTGVTSASFGYNSTATGVGLQAYVATGCYGQNGSGTSETINFKYNMP